MSNLYSVAPITVPQAKPGVRLPTLIPLGPIGFGVTARMVAAGTERSVSLTAQKTKSPFRKAGIALALPVAGNKPRSSGGDAVVDADG